MLCCVGLKFHLMVVASDKKIYPERHVGSRGFTSFINTWDLDGGRNYSGHWRVKRRRKKREGRMGAVLSTQVRFTQAAAASAVTSVAWPGLLLLMDRQLHRLLGGWGQEGAPGSLFTSHSLG